MWDSYIYNIQVFFYLIQEINPWPGRTRPEFKRELGICMPQPYFDVNLRFDKVITLTRVYSYLTYQNLVIFLTIHNDIGLKGKNQSNKNP